jgi:hypothetical protein
VDKLFNETLNMEYEASSYKNIQKKSCHRRIFLKLVLCSMIYVS